MSAISTQASQGHWQQETRALSLFLNPVTEYTGFPIILPIFLSVSLRSKNSPCAARFWRVSGHSSACEVLKRKIGKGYTVLTERGGETSPS